MTEEPPVLDDPMVILLKQKELQLLRERLDMVTNDGLAYYRPHEKQHEYHCSPAKRRGVFAGNRFGKSESDAAETVAWFIGERTWYKFSFPIYGMREGKKVVISFHEGHENHPLVRQGIPQHATKQLVIATDWKKVDEVWTSVMGDPPGKLWKFLPKHLDISPKRNHEGVIDQIYNNKTNAIIRFTTEQAFIKNPQSGESTDYDRIAVDEPITEDMWKAHSRGLIDRNGQGDFTLTALRERWIYDKFFPDVDDTSGFLNAFAVRASMHDNPYLSDEAKQQYLHDLTEDERSARESGLPLELSGLVYKEFRREIHVLKDLPTGWTTWTNPPADWTIYVAIDVHEQTPQAALFVAVPPLGVPIIYDEIWRACVTDELIEEVKLRTAGRTVGFIKADPRAWLEDPTFKVSMASVFLQRGLYIEPASKAKSFGVTNMQGIFKKRRQIVLPDGSRAEAPVVYFTPSVRKCLWELARYIFDKENKPVDKDDHFMENMYRLFITPLPHQSPFFSRPVRDYTQIDMTRNAMEFDTKAERAQFAIGAN